MQRYLVVSSYDDAFDDFEGAHGVVVFRRLGSDWAWKLSADPDDSPRFRYGGGRIVYVVIADVPLEVAKQSLGELYEKLQPFDGNPNLFACETNEYLRGFGPRETSNINSLVRIGSIFLGDVSPTRPLSLVTRAYARSWELVDDPDAIVQIPVPVTAKSVVVYVECESPSLIQESLWQELSDGREFHRIVDTNGFDGFYAVDVAVDDLPIVARRKTFYPRSGEMRLTVVTYNI